MAKELTPNEKRYWRIVAAIQELSRLSDQDIDENIDIRRHVEAMANIVFFYQDNGVAKVQSAAKKAALEALGISTLIPKNRKD